MLETIKPQNSIFRIGRTPDPWRPLDWSFANVDGTFGNRFDDSEGIYRVLYASSQPLSCYMETLARFRPDFTLLAELREIEGEDDFLPLRNVPREWFSLRLMGTAASRGEYADIHANQWISFLRGALAPECLRLGLNDFDAGVLQRATPRRLTQLASSEVNRKGYAGIYYRSRHGHNLDNWAIFEPFQISPGRSSRLSEDDPALLEALNMLGLKIID